MANALAVIPDGDLGSGNLYVEVDGREKPVRELHPDDPAYARLEPQVVLRQHPDAYYRLRLKPADVWQRAPGPGLRESLEAFLGQRWPGLFPPGARASDGPSDGQRLSTWGWIAAIGSALNAVGLLFYPLSDSQTLATLHAYGGQPTALARLVSHGWFSPLLAALTAACLVQAYLSSTRRRLWITVSYFPALMGFVAAVVGALSSVSALLGNIK
jgi:hypothetical protein